MSTYGSMRLSQTFSPSTYRQLNSFKQFFSSLANIQMMSYHPIVPSCQWIDFVLPQENAQCDMEGLVGCGPQHKSEQQWQESNELPFLKTISFPLWLSPL